MKFSVSPVGSIVVASPFTVVVDLCDPTSTDEVTISLGTNPGPGVLSGTLTVAAVEGVALFTDLEIDTVGVGYTLVATAPQQLPPVGQFQPGVSSAAPCCGTGGCFFQRGYYYNFPPCGTTFSENTVTGNYPHANLNPAPVTESITSDPFTVTV